MDIDPMQLPAPCRSGRLCESCRAESDDGAAFRAEQGAQHPEMFNPGTVVCHVGLNFGHRGAAPWAVSFAAGVRERMQAAAVAQAANAPTFGPGDVVKLVLARLGYRVNARCGCDEFRQQMNAWGWRGSFRRRREILDWFAAKAREQNLEVTDAGLWSLIRAGLKDLLRRRD